MRVEKPFDFARDGWEWRAHHERYRRYVKAMPRRLVCQECGGAGGEKINIGLDDGTGPWEWCGFCEGTGLLTPHGRGLWLRYRREYDRHGNRRVRGAA